MKVNLTVDIDGTEKQQDDMLDELRAAHIESEVVRIHTNAEVIPAVIVELND